MTSYESNIILNEINNLLTYSCHGDSAVTGRFKTLHRAIIKKHFNALEVMIREERKEIDMKIPVAKKHFVNIHYKCADLEEFLKSCIEKDRGSLAFYQNILTYYNVVSVPN